MDTSQLPSILGWLKSAFTKAPYEPQGKTYLASPRLNYPTDEDVDYARKYDYSYGQPWAPEFEGKSARIAAGDPNEVPIATQTFGSSKGVVSPLKPDPLKNLYAKAVLAAEGSALAKLGFDPNRTAVDLLRDPTKVNIVGMYRAAPTDQIYANARTPSAIVHESIHRGINRLQNSPYWQKEFEPFKTGSNEMLVRHIMQSKMGDPERVEDEAILAANPGAVGGLQQQKDARDIFTKSPFAKDRQKIIDKMEEAAANYIAAKRPGGPR